MATTIKPGLVDELQAYGAEDVSKCFNCGNCSAVCVHSEAPHVLPRRSMHALQLGLEDKLKGQLEPWLCYYCGECSEQCPKEAEPGETMMSMRRWLTSKYDFSGISGSLLPVVPRGRSSPSCWRRSSPASASCCSASCTAAASTCTTARTPSCRRHYVHRFDWTMATVLVVLLGINVVRMWRNVMGGTVARGIGSYLAALSALPYHFFTQAKYQQCERKRPWAVHLALMLSYVTMLVLIMFFLYRMQSGPAIDWRVHVFGYLASIGLIVAVVLNIRGRLKKDSPQHQHSHESDWMFLYLLLYVAVTGVLQTILHRTGLDTAANVMYVIHLMGVVPMLVLEVPVRQVGAPRVPAAGRLFRPRARARGGDGRGEGGEAAAEAAS